MSDRALLECLYHVGRVHPREDKNATKDWRTFETSSQVETRNIRTQGQKCQHRRTRIQSREEQERIIGIVKSLTWGETGKGRKWRCGSNLSQNRECKEIVSPISNVYIFHILQMQKNIWQLHFSEKRECIECVFLSAGYVKSYKSWWSLKKGWNSYIQKAKTAAETTFQPWKICGKIAYIKTTKFYGKSSLIIKM